MRAGIITTNRHRSAGGPIYPYQTQEVRDLAWACFSPPLLSLSALGSASAGVADCSPELTPRRRLWLERLDRDAEALRQHLAASATQRVGLYFEHLWHFFLREDPETELVAHNLAVRLEQQTLGEFDCLYYCHRRQRHFHLELAVKYFLGVSEAGMAMPDGAAHCWLGPNTRDRLDLKLAHMLQRQIRLGDHPAAALQLQALGIDTPGREIALRGYLFQGQTHFQAQTPPVPLPAGTRCGEQTGDWLHLGQLPAYLHTLDSAHYLVLPRMRWLSRAVLAARDDALTAAGLDSALAAHFAQRQRPLLIAALDSGGMEVQRFFVTPDTWPLPA